MKKIIKFILAMVLVLFVFLSSSCRDSSVDEEILRDAENFHIADSRPERYYGNFIPETAFAPTDTSDFEGIFSPLYNFNNNRFYFPVRRDNHTLMLSYVNLQTGEHRLICPDPFCRHVENECRYLGFQRTFFARENVIYTHAITGDFGGDINYIRWSILRVDLNNDRIDVVYQAEEDFTKQDVDIAFIYGNTLYFFVTTRITAENERTATSVRTLKRLDISNHQIIETKSFPNEYVNIAARLMYIDEGKFYFDSLTHIFTTDFNLENKKVIYNFNPNEFLENYFFDKNTGEFFFLVRNVRNHIGSIYVYANDELKRLNMPHENIFSFQLTNSKIYYSPFNPEFLGISPRDDLINDRIYNFTGGRIYVTDRHIREEYELVFEACRNFLIGTEVCRYVIIGDYLYFAHMQFISNGRYVWFSSAHYLEKVRINMRENTIRYLGFD